MGEDRNKQRSQGRATGVSRRSFIAKAVAGASAAAVLGKQQSTKAESAPAISIRVPETFAEASKTPPRKSEFPMTGAQVFARACKEEGLQGLFCCPGNYMIINAMASEGIPVYSGRCEGPMAHAADAFARVTGEVAATSGTEGPGFTNMINGIAAANAARTPLLVLASNMRMGDEDSEAGIQLMYQQPLTEGIKKYGKRLINAERIHEYAAYAFRKLRTGIPRPVHLDFPTEIATHRFASVKDVEYFYDKTKYRTESKPYPDPNACAAAIELIKAAERPLIVSSTGVFYSKAWDELKAFAEKAQIPVTETGPMRGQFPDDNPLNASASWNAVRGADLVILVGQYCIPPRRHFAVGPDAKYIRIDPDPEDIGRNIPVEVGIVSCEKAALAALAEACPSLKHDSWIADLRAGREGMEKDNADYYKQGMGFIDAVHPAVIAKELSDFMYRGHIPKEQTVFNSGGYVTSRYMRRWNRGFRPGQLLYDSYQFGAIGPNIAMAVGTCAAVRQGVGPQAPYRGAPVICLTSDAAAAYTIMELETAAKYKMPIVVVVYSNNAWGTFTPYVRNPVHLAIQLFQENVRYDKVAEGLGAHGEYVTRPSDFSPALERCYQLAAKENVCSLINCQGRKEFSIRGPGSPGFLGNNTLGYTAYSH
jgi:thiamine pyrophosphate-dependent acetolactate synthase large subunit-like protein